MSRKFLFPIAMLVLMLALAACGGPQPTVAPAATATQPPQASATPAPAATSQPADPTAAPTEPPAAVPARCLAAPNAYVNAEHKYCFLYPDGFVLGEFFPGMPGVFGPALDDSVEPVRAVFGLDVTEPPAGSTLAAVVDAFVADQPVAPLRSTVEFAGQPAERLENVPGREGSREVLLLHEGRLFRFIFRPALEGFPMAAPDVEALFATIDESFTFLPDGEPGLVTTPIETATPDAVPTADASPTPAAPATPDPNAGVGEMAYEDHFDGRAGWFWTFSDEAASFGATGGQLNVETHGAADTWRFVVSQDLSLGNQQLRVTARVETCDQFTQYGPMFRGQLEPDDTYSFYVFQFDCEGRARFVRLQGPTTLPITEWAAYPAINSGAGAENDLLVWMSGGQFHFYTNGQYLFSAQDSGLSAGLLGFYVRQAGALEARLNFTDLEARTVTAP